MDYGVTGMHGVNECVTATVHTEQAGRAHAGEQEKKSGNRTS
jgi:hypothetical protein